MAPKKAIRKGDTTTHGGFVLEGVSTFQVHGKPVSVIGHMVSCPKCEGVYPIVEGAGNFPVAGKAVAVEGMKTACGAELIASQDVFTIAVSDNQIFAATPSLYADKSAAINNNLVNYLVDPQTAPTTSNNQTSNPKRNMVMVMTNVNDWDMVGNHAGLLINPGKADAFLYDPGGSYCAGKGCTINGSHVQRGSGGFFEGKEVDLKHYTKYQDDDDGEYSARYHIFYVTDADKEEIVSNVLDTGDVMGGLCAKAVSSVISGVGPFKNYGGARTPKGLRSDMEKLEAQRIND